MSLITNFQQQQQQTSTSPSSIKAPFSQPTTIMMMNFDDIFQIGVPSLPEYHNGNAITMSQLSPLQHYSQEQKQEYTTRPIITKSLNEQLLKQQEKYLNLQNRVNQPVSDLKIEQECIAPQKTCFNTLQEGKDFLKEYMKLAKIGLVICDSRKDSYTSYRCDRGGCYRDRRNINSTNRVRKLRTRKCNCQFKLILKLNKLDSKWYLIFKNLKHNHNLTDLENLPILRRRDDNVKQEIKLLLDSGIKNPTQIKNFLLKKYDGIVITKRDIYNEIGEYSRKYKSN